jgi:hypothetical protein
VDLKQYHASMQDDNAALALNPKDETVLVNHGNGYWRRIGIPLRSATTRPRLRSAPQINLNLSMAQQYIAQAQQKLGQYIKGNGDVRIKSDDMRKLFQEWYPIRIIFAPGDSPLTRSLLFIARPIRNLTLHESSHLCIVETEI